MNHGIRIAIIEDNRAYARSVEEIIRSSSGIEWAGTYSSAEEASAAFQTEPLPEVDVILLDLRLPGRSGLALIPVLRNHVPGANILVLTNDDDYRTVLEAIRLGVKGYILKDAPIAELRRAIQEVHEGGGLIDPRLSRLVLQVLDAPDASDDNPLSERERQVLELMAMGYVKKEVAERLGLSYSAIALYTSNIYQKLQVPNIAAAVGAAIRRGLI